MFVKIITLMIEKVKGLRRAERDKHRKKYSIIIYPKGSGYIIITAEFSMISRQKTVTGVSDMNKEKIPFYIIMAAIGVGVFLAAVEGVARLAGLELRTFAQIWKGFYLWLVMPFLILFSGNALLMRRSREKAAEEEHSVLSRVAGWTDKVVVGVFCLVILAVASLRGLSYIFSRDMVTERMMPDGYIEGTWSEFLSESHYDYYEPVALLFRKPFPGWTQTEVIEKVREKYSADAELVERQENGDYVFRVPDVLEEGAFVYFHVSDSYHAGSNYFFQVLCSEASHFWSGSRRTVRVDGEKNRAATLEEARDTGGPADSYETSGRLSVTCNGSAEDIAACASDLAGWLQFVKDAGQLPYDTDPLSYNMLSRFSTGSGDDFFDFHLFPLEDYIGDDPWSVRYGRIKEELESAFSEHAAWEEEWQRMAAEREQDESAAQEAESAVDESGMSFMDAYDGSYEKECLVGDGQIRYRMVVEDAALGSRFYGLLKSTDGGETWQMSNPDPFDQQMGMGIDFTFLDERFGFATLMHNGGDEADLYVTEDGGDSYQSVVIEKYMVTLENGYTYAPYDYPQMPYEEDGVLIMLCGQGADGDYDGGDGAGLALYQSEDGGHTFRFVEIRKG